MTGSELPREARKSWGGSADMSAWEAMMWRAEGDLRTRSTGVIVEFLDSEPEWDRLLAAHDRLSRQIPRLRERVVEPPLPLVSPSWSSDPHFELTYHVQHVRAPREGTDEELFAIAAAMAARPLDPSRPPWEAMLVGGLTGGRAAYLLKVHHSLSDGLGLLQLLDLTHGRSPDPEPADPEPVAAPRSAQTPTGVLISRLQAALTAAPADLLRATAQSLTRFTSDPLGATAEAVRFGASLRRVLTPPAVERSPVLREGGHGYRMLSHDVPLATLRAAGKAAGGSVNDAFLAAVLGSVRLYHEHLGLLVEHIPIGVPVSMRTDKDPMGGNKFAGARLVAPVGEPDPRERIRLIHDFIAVARTEPAIGFLDIIAPVLSRLPGPVLAEIAGGMTAASDLQCSNLAGIGRPLYLAGAKVTRIYPMGPRPGVAAMVTMLSYEGTCCVGVNLNPDAITDDAVFTKCLHAGFDEVLALAR